MDWRFFKFNNKLINNGDKCWNYFYGKLKLKVFFFLFLYYFKNLRIVMSQTYRMLKLICKYGSKFPHFHHSFCCVLKFQDYFEHHYSLLLILYRWYLVLKKNCSKQIPDCKYCTLVQINLIVLLVYLLYIFKKINAFLDTNNSHLAFSKFFWNLTVNFDGNINILEQYRTLDFHIKYFTF